MYATYCKLCPLSLIITKIILDICKPLHIISFSPNQLVFMLAGAIESEIQALIDREFIKTLTQTLVHTCTVTVESYMKQELVLIDLIEEFEERIGRGFDWKLHDLILISKVFTKLKLILCERSFSNVVREASVFAIAKLIRFNKDVFVGQILISKTVCALISLTSVRSIQILCTLIRSIKSPIVDEIVSGDIIPKLVGFLTSDEVSIRAMAVNCVLEVGYFGRKEAIDAMLEVDLVKRLLDLQRCENGDVFGSCLLMVGLVGLNGFCLKIIIIQHVK
ncbi:putative armadillo-like helical protein [Helianthus anomalus]